MLHDSSCSHLLAHNNPDQQIILRVGGSPEKQNLIKRINFVAKKGIHESFRKRDQDEGKICAFLRCTVLAAEGDNFFGGQFAIKVSK